MLDERLDPTDQPESIFLVAESLREVVFAASLHPFVYHAAAEDNGVGEYERQQMSGKPHQDTAAALHSR
jgi:hypothetical protein